MPTRKPSSNVEKHERANAPSQKPEFTSSQNESHKSNNSVQEELKVSRLNVEGSEQELKVDRLNVKGSEQELKVGKLNVEGSEQELKIDRLNVEGSEQESKVGRLNVEGSPEELKVDRLNVEGDAPNVANASLSENNLQPSNLQPSTQTNLQPSLTQDWLIHFQRYSRLLMAVVEPGTFILRFANDYFCSLTGIAKSYSEVAEREISLSGFLPDLKGTAVESLYRKHVLHLVLRDIYQIPVPNWRLLERPVVVSLKSPLYSEPRSLEMAFRSDWLSVTRKDAEIDEFADLDWAQQLGKDGSLRAIDSSTLEAWSQRLCLENYQLSGQLLLEGSDVTERETVLEIGRILIDRDSILRPEKFRRVNKRLRSLFRATNSLILCAENEQVRLFMMTERKELTANVHSLPSLIGSNFLRAADANRVWNVPDLSKDCPSECERSLLERGVRSLLIVPLVVKAIKSGKGSRQLVGIVGIMSDRPHHFDDLDRKYAEELIPAFTTALRQAIQQRFTNIHPSVEWRFLQEAERRSWGLPTEPIVFANVYPLYGISDIRGSSDERNRAIQDDLLEQFQLALRVLEAVCQHQHSAYAQQLRLDLLEYTEQLKETITVDAEVTTLKILSDRLEVYLDYFAQCGSAALAAVETYRQSCDNDHKSVYLARSHYDKTITQINSHLKETWEQWQVRMQQVVSHYCDIESTDGINHMIYVGESIDPKFTIYHLRSLRYEQLRAICDCARAAFNLQSLFDTQLEVTHLVLVQDLTVDIIHDENTERLFEVRGSRDIRYEIVKKRIDKAVDEQSRTRITQPGMLTVVYSTEEEWAEYQQYLRYLAREGWVDSELQCSTVEPLQGITGLKYARVRVLPAPGSLADDVPGRKDNLEELMDAIATTDELNPN